MLEPLTAEPFPLTTDEAALLSVLADQELAARLEGPPEHRDGVDLDTLDNLVKRLQTYATS